MRVCLVGPAYPYRGGIAHFTTLLAREFAKDNEVLVVNFSRLYPSVFFPGKTQYDSSSLAFHIDSERLIDCINPLTYVKAARRIARFNPDIIVFQWWHPFFSFAYSGIRYFLRRNLKRKIIFLCHNVLPHESSSVDRFLIRIAFSGVEGFLVQSQEDLRHLEKMLGDKIRKKKTAVHPHPIYEVFKKGSLSRSRARKELGLDGNIVLFFGLVRPYKGLGVLLRSFASSLSKIDAKLLIVGEFYEDRSSYDRLISELGIGNRVVVIDRYVPNEEVEIYFEASDLVVLPYISATQSGIVQIAYAFEKPVIVTSVGGLPDVVEEGKTGFIVSPNDPGKLSDAIVEFFTSGRSVEMAAAIRAVKGRFSWGKCKEALLDLLPRIQSR